MEETAPEAEENLGESFDVEEDPEENNAPEEEENQLDDVLRRDEQPATLENLSIMLTCAICLDLVTKATEITCCGQTFCYGCVERWVHEKASCPMCRQENLTEGAFRRNRPVQRMADEILTRCAYCHVELKHGVISSHLKTCSHARHVNALVLCTKSHIQRYLDCLPLEHGFRPRDV